MADMSYRPLGDSGLVVSVVGVGCNAFGRRIDAEASTMVVQAALDQGVTLFDTADTYGFGASESMLGKALGSHRSDVVIATKFGSDMQGRNGADGVRINAAAVVVYGRTGGWEGVTNNLNSSRGFVLLSPSTSWTGRPITSRSPKPVNSRAPRPVPISRPCWSRMKTAALGAG